MTFQKLPFCGENQMLSSREKRKEAQFESKLSTPFLTLTTAME